MKLFRILIAAALILAFLPFHSISVCASTDEVIMFEDGSYIIVSISSIDTRTMDKKVASKEYAYYSANEVLLWTVTLTGYFSYDGTSSTCTYSAINVDIINESWELISGTSTESGNTATANVIIGRRLLGVIVNKKTVNISISCDANGNIQ